MQKYTKFWNKFGQAHRRRLLDLYAIISSLWQAKAPGRVSRGSHRIDAACGKLHAWPQYTFC